MLGGRLKSALFIDFENVGSRNLSETLPNWLAWLERGEFDRRRKRRTLIEKRIYWNSSTDHLGDRFKQFGFAPILCEKYARLKNGADIRMTIDIIERTIDNPDIKEFILFTRDSDFVPVLQRLRQKKKRTAILVDQNDHARRTIYRRHADIVIPVDDLANAGSYRRPSGRIAVREATAAAIAFVRSRWRQYAEQRAARRAAKKAAEQAAVADALRDEQLEAAVDAVIRISSLTANQFVARRRISSELLKIEGFTRSGKKSYFGYGSYEALMHEVAVRSDRIKISKVGNGGIGVMYVPKDDEEE
jgi:hypothetical protein